MTNHAEVTGGHRWSGWRIAGWSVPVLLLLLPLVAMQVTDEVVWTTYDFVVAAVLFGSVGLAFEVIIRKSSSLAYRFGAGFAVIAAFLTIWVNGAVGMIGSEDNPYNLLFGGVPLVALLGAIVARFQAAGMARAMGAAAVAQAVVGGVGLSIDMRDGAFSIAFGALWLIAAALLWNSASANESEIHAPR